MEAPAPIVLQTPKSEEILYKKEHTLVVNKISYKLIISMDRQFIYFKINEINNNSLFYFQNKYNYKNLLELFKLNNDIYINLEIIFDLIENAYLNKDLKLIFGDENNLHLKINLMNENKKKKYIIILNKHKLGLNNKFSIIINEINNLKLQKNKEINENKFKKLHLLLENLQTSTNILLEKNMKRLSLLKKQVDNNEKIIKKNSERILSFKKQIKDIEDKYIINNNNIKIDSNNQNIQINNDIKNEELKIEKLYDNNSSYSLLYKIILIGDTYCGKTWIIKSFISFPSESFGTTGVDINSCFLKINNKIIKLLITDCPGNEKYFTICMTNTKGKDLIMFVYSIDNKDSFVSIKNRIKRIKNYNKDKQLYILIGSKIDLENNRQISYEQGQELAILENMNFFIEVSAKMSFNIEELFFEAIRLLYKKKK